jgi:general secretion pathway protein J
MAALRRAPGVQAGRGRPSPLGSTAGFTLIEVVVAVAITALLGAMTLGAFRQVDHAAEIARDQGDRYAGGRLALTRLARELSMAFLSDHYDKNRMRERPTLFQGREDKVLFTTFAHERLARDAKESDQAVVEYTLESDPGSSGEQALFRREKARIDDEADRGGRKDLVAEHVAGFRLQYWDAKRKDWSREWSTRSVDHADDLPSRVRLELELKLADGRTEKLVTEARVALTRPLDF